MISLRGPRRLGGFQHVPIDRRRRRAGRLDRDHGQIDLAHRLILVGIDPHDIPFVYLAGGFATFISARLIGQWADRHGKVEAYRWVALITIVPLLVLTHVGRLPLWGWLICSTSFFVLISGRMIPAMAIIASAAQANLRGTFMSLNGTVQSLAMGLATTLAGFLITLDGSGRIVGYPLVGYVAVAANLLAIWFVSRIVMHGRHA